MLRKAMTDHKGVVEDINDEKITLAEEGKYPRQLIIQNKKGEQKEYSLVRTRSGNFMLNK